MEVLIRFRLRHFQCIRVGLLRRVFQNPDFDDRCSVLKSLVRQLRNRVLSQSLFVDLNIGDFVISLTFAESGFSCGD